MSVTCLHDTSLFWNTMSLLNDRKLILIFVNDTYCPKKWEVSSSRHKTKPITITNRQNIDTTLSITMDNSSISKKYTPQTSWHDPV